MLNFWEDRDVPKQLLFSGNAATNIIIARTIRQVRCLNLDLSDGSVQAHLKQYQSKFYQLLTALEFDSLEEAIEDSEFREFARQYVYGACKKMKVEGIWVRTVRHQLGQLLNGFNKSTAHNLIFLGDGNGTLSDRLVGSGVIQIRSDSAGMKVTAVPINGCKSPYNDGQIRALTVVKH